MHFTLLAHIIDHGWSCVLLADSQIHVQHACLTLIVRSMFKILSTWATRSRLHAHVHNTNSIRLLYSPRFSTRHSNTKETIQLLMLLLVSFVPVPYLVWLRTIAGQTSGDL